MSGSFLCVTGTDTDVGKTVATAYLAAAALSRGERVAVDKPTQTGVGPTDPGDVDTVARLLGHPQSLTLSEGTRLWPAMAPVDAAWDTGGDAAVAALPGLSEHLARIAALAREHDTVLVEGAGGLLVRLTAAGETLADLAVASGAALAVVVRPDLGTLNHTALTLEAAAHRGVRPGPLVVGSWPDEPTRVNRANLVRLREMAAAHGYTWGGTLPAALGAAGPSRFARAASALSTRTAADERMVRGT